MISEWCDEIISKDTACTSLVTLDNAGDNTGLFFILALSVLEHMFTSLQLIAPCVSVQKVQE